MNRIRTCKFTAMALFGMVALIATDVLAADPLPSWNDTDAKQSVVAFVEKVTAQGSPDFVPADERIAVFDNDGTLWCEQPMYVQLRYLIDRVQALAPEHPEWKSTQPFQGVLENDPATVVASGKPGLMQLAAATHAGMTVEEFDRTVTEWITTARHPRTGKLYTEMVYQPMLDLLAYLRDNGFKTFIVSGGGIEFMRPWTQRVYGIPPEQVVGSSLKLKFELQGGVPVLMKLAEIDLVDDKAGKPVGIASHIGRRPIFAAGNSDGDLQMLQYTTIARGADDATPRFGLIVHHTDAEREYAYDRESHFGKLDVGLTEAEQRGWVVVDMKEDWKQLWPEAAASPAGGGGSIIGEWLVEDIGGKGVVDNSHSTLQIAADGAATGDGGVNRFRGQATIDNGSLSFGPLLSTKIGGPPALMNQETKFLGALGKVKRYRIAPTGLLHLLDGEGNEIARLSKVDSWE